MLKVIRPKFSVKEHIKAWAERKGYYIWEPSPSRSDRMVLQVQKKVERKGWFGYTSYEDVLKYHYYEKIPKKAADNLESDGENLEGKKLFWFKAWPTYFNMVEVLAEEIEAELSNSENKVVLVTMEK